MIFVVLSAESTIFILSKVYENGKMRNEKMWLDQLVFQLVAKGVECPIGGVWSCWKSYKYSGICDLIIRKSKPYCTQNYKVGFIMRRINFIAHIFGRTSKSYASF
jgi:hypothetical protein